MHLRNVWVQRLPGWLAVLGTVDARGVGRRVRRRKQRHVEHIERTVSALGHAGRPEG